MKRVGLLLFGLGLILSYGWVQTPLPKDLQQKYERAITLARAGKYAQAEPLLKEIVQKKPNFAPAHLSLGLVYRFQAKWEPAINHLRRASILNPKDPTPLIELTRIALERGKKEDAEGYLRTLRTRHPNHKEIPLLAGSLAMMRSEWQTAYTEFKQALKSQPNDFRILYNIGISAYQLGKLDESRSFLERTTRAKPDYTTGWKALGMVYESLSRRPDAIRAYSEVLKREPDDLPTLLKRAQLYQKEENPEQALHDYEHILKIYPRNLDALVGAGLILMQKEQYEQALRYLGSALNMFKSDEPFYWSLLTEVAHCEYHLKRYGKARAYFAEILKYFPKNRRAYEGQYQTLLAQGVEEQEILPLLRRWEQNLPDDPQPLLLIAKLYERNQQTGLAEAEYQKLLQKFPRHSEARQEYARFLSRTGRDEEAVRQFDTVLAEYPNEVSALFGKARALEKRAQYEQALQLYRKIAEQDPTNELALLGVAAMLRKLERIDEAGAVYRQLAFRPEPNNLAITSMVNMLREAKRSDELIAFLRECVERHGYTYLPLLAVEIAQAGRPEDALQVYRDAIQRDPNNGELYKGLGVLAEQLKRPDDALSAYQQALRIDPKDTWTLTRIGMLHLQQERYSAAWNTLTQALEINPDELGVYPLLEQIAQKANRQQEYLQLLQTLTQKDTLAQEASKAYVEWLRREGRLEEALAFVEGKLRNRPEDVPLLFLKVNLLTLMNRHQETLPVYEVLGRLQPKDTLTLRSWATQAEQYGTLEQTLRAYEALYKAEPDEVSTGLKLARLYHQAGNRERALDILEQLEENFPNNEDVKRVVNEILASR